MVFYYKQPGRGIFLSPVLIDLCFYLVPLTLHSDRVDLNIKHNETPQLIQLEIHPELFCFAKFLFVLHVSLLFRDHFPAQQAFEFPDEGVVEHELHPCTAHTHFQM